jgi:NADH-quinone oxidoreductase subunit E
MSSASSTSSPSPVEKGAAGSGLLSEPTREAILALHGKYPQAQSAVLDALRLAQDEIGYVPVEATNEVAALLGLSPHHVRSLASFYTMFFTEPVGRQIVEVCDNLSCALWGSQRVLARLGQELGISVGETTPDGSVTLLRTIECLAACGGAPALRVNTTYHEKMTDEKIVALVQQLVRDGDAPDAAAHEHPDRTHPNRGAK